MTLETTPTEYVESAGTRFAYRKWGRPEGIPLVFLQHFTGTMDSWDPAVVDPLPEDRPAIAFDNTGGGKSASMPPDTVAQMASDAKAFIAAHGFTTVDPLGFSLGGMIAQTPADRPR